uniref:G-protein coupled receptors family 1 profile domain-containing protein n=1 Tax=Tetranychus urticae TaxID=32264 RepID=T1KUH8_TETUR
MDLIGGSTTSFNLTADAVTNLTLLLFYSLPNILNVSSTRESSTVYLDTRRNNNSDYKHDSPHYHSHSHLNGESPFFPPISSFLSSSSNWLLHEPIDSSSSQPPIMQSSSSSESDSYNDHSLTLDSERPFLQSTSFPLDSPFKLNNGDYSSSLESFPSFSLTIPLVNMSSDSNSNEDESQSSFRQPNNESKIFNQFDDQFSGLTDLTIGLTSSNVTENQVSSDWWSSSLSPSVIFKSNETIFTFNASQDNDGEPSFPVDNNSIGLTPFNASNHVNQLVIEYNWFYLMLGLLVFVGCFGNILVCLAICLERRLQNATNFFLLSLAIADLLVSILVMPMSIVNEVYGKHCSFTLKTKLPSTLNSVSS